MKKSKTYKCIDLFAGCGGLSLGLSRAGFEIVVAVEINKDAVSTYKHNLVEKAGHNTSLIMKDINKLTEEELMEMAGDEAIHLIAAGPPCQGFSMAGRRDINDPRNSNRNDGLVGR